MEDKFPYLKIKKSLSTVIGDPDRGTRVFRQRGDVNRFRWWLIDLDRFLRGNVLPATWVPEFVGVSRAAVHKRIKVGKLTMLVFEREETELNLLLKYKTRRKGEFAYCIRTECEAWLEEIEWREARKGPPEMWH